MTSKKFIRSKLGMQIGLQLLFEQIFVISDREILQVILIVQTFIKKFLNFQYFLKSVFFLIITKLINNEVDFGTSE